MHKKYRDKCKADPQCRETLRRNEREEKTRQKYGMSTEAYMQMAWAQDFRCAICGKHEADTGAFGLVIEHDHCSNRVRGLTCPHCNAMLGWYETNRTAIHQHLGG